MALPYVPNVRDLKAKGDVSGLIQALSHTEAVIRQASATALGQLGDSGAIAPLVGLLRDGDPLVCKAAADALDGLGWRAAEVQESVAYAIARKEWRRCIELGAPAARPLLTFLVESSYSVGDAPWEDMEQTLAAVCDEQAVEDLVAIAREKRIYLNIIKSRLVRSLIARIGAPAGPPLVRALEAEILQEEGPTNKSGIDFISDVLAKTGETAVEPLLQLLSRLEEGLPRSFSSKAPDREYKKADGALAVANALGKVGVTALGPLLSWIEQVDRNELPTGVVIALVKVGEAAVDPLVQSAVRVGVPLEAALLQPGWLTGRPGLGKAIDAARQEPFYKERIDRANTEAATQASSSFVSLGIYDFITYMGSMRHDIGPEVKAIGPHMMALLAILKSRPENLQELIDRALDLLRQPVLRALVAALKKEENYLSSVLMMLGPRGAQIVEASLHDEVSTALLEIIRNTKLGMLGSLRTEHTEAIKVFAAMGSPVLDRLIAALQDESSPVRRCAVEALRQIGDRRAAGPLQAVLQDADKGVRKAAAQALKALQ